MRLDVANDHVVHAWCFAAVFLLAERVGPGIDVAAQALGPFARGCRRPFRPAPDRPPALPSGMAVIQRKRPVARAVDADREAAHLGIKNPAIPPLGRFSRRGRISRSIAIG